MPGVAAAFYDGRSDLILLSIDAAAVGDLLVYEELYERGEDFPHVYGPIPMHAITAAEALSA